MFTYNNTDIVFSNLIHVLLYVSFLVIILLILNQIRTKKIIRELLIKKRVLTSLNTNYPGVILKYTNDSSRTITFISKNALTLTGYQPIDLINNTSVSFKDLIHPNDQFVLLEAIQKCTPNNRSYKAEYRIRTKDNAEKWILEQGIYYATRKGKIKRFEGILTDISDSKFTEKILKESQQRFQLLIEHSPIGICITYDNLITYYNPLFINIFGLSEQKDIIGTSLVECIAPEARLSFEKYKKKFDLNLPSTSGYESIGLRNDGTHFPIQLYFTHVNLGDFSATIMFVIDITKRKKNEEELISANQRLNDIIELIPDPTFIIDKNKRVIHWNKAIEELTGYKKEEVLNKEESYYSKLIYGVKTPMLVDLVDEDITNYENNQTNIQKDIRKINNKLYGNFSGVFRNNEFYHLWGVATPLFDSLGNRFGTIEVIRDITEEKLKEEALRDSEIKSRIILDTNQDIILLINADTTILDCNLSFAISAGKSREELIGTSVSAYYHKNPKWDHTEYITKALETGKVQIFDIDYDDIHHYTIRIYPVKDNNDRINKFVIYAQNITKLKNAEKALQESEEEYRTITESITDYLYKVVLKNEKITFQFKNPGIEKILGYRISDFSSNPNLFYNIVLEKDKEILHINLNKAIEHRKNVNFEHRIIHKNGDHIWLSHSLIIKESNEKNIELNGVIKDISLRKHFENALKIAEERYRAVFDQSGLASSVYDLNGTLIMQNKYAANLLGGNTHDFIGKKIDEIYTPEIARLEYARLNETIYKGDITLDERELVLSTGKYWLKTTSHIIKNNTGEVIGVQFISQDITEKKELDNKILTTIIETEEKERIHFAQELHDGLGPIISAIKMYVQWLSRPDSKIAQHEIITDTERLINEAGDAIREISFKLSPHILNNFGLIEALKTFTEKVNQSKKLEILLDYNFTRRFEETMETVIYRILCECINNTIKHASASHITIKILKFITKIRITYIDNGVGFNTDHVLNQKMGNGLLNMQSRLQSINGSLKITSQPGKGVKIIILI